MLESNDDKLNITKCVPQEHRKMVHRMKQNGMSNTQIKQACLALGIAFIDVYSKSTVILSTPTTGKWNTPQIPFWYGHRRF